MASKYWIKLYHEILDDPKMGLIADRLWRRTIEIFLLAGEYHRKGLLPSVADMAWRLRIPEAELLADLKELEKAGIVEPLEEDSEATDWFVSNFAGRQKPMTSAERSARFRKAAGTKTSKETWRTRLWRGLPESPGIYELKCEDLNEAYIGATVNLQQRVRQHITELATQTDNVMAHWYRDYGPGSITVKILAQTEDETLLADLEGHWHAKERTLALVNVDPAKRHRSWPQNDSGTKTERIVPQDRTNCPLDKDIDIDKIEEPTGGYAAPKTPLGPIPLNLDSWKDEVFKSENRAATVVLMVKCLYPKNDPPEYGKVGGTAKTVGGWGRLVTLLWEGQTQRIDGDVLPYMVGMHKGQGKDGKSTLDKSMEAAMAVYLEAEEAEATSGNA